MAMSLIEAFLQSHEALLTPFGVGAASDVSAAVVTPRFPTSRHVVFLVFVNDSPDPILVAKVPRVDDAGGFLAREADNLLAVHRADQGQARSVPRLVAYEVFQQEVLLVESAVTGRLMRPSIVRREFDSCLDQTLRWLLEFNLRTATSDGWNEAAFVDLIAGPLDALQQRVAVDSRTRRLMTRTRLAAEPLADVNLPLVFEHGDLASPNLFLLDGGGVGIIDWELSLPKSLPAVDLFFFLAFMAFSREGATSIDEYVAAFRSAFFGRSAWARPHVGRYAAALDLPAPALKPLFVLCWSRYVANFLARAAYAGQQSGAGSAGVLQNERYWTLWQYAVDHFDEIDFGD